MEHFSSLKDPRNQVPVIDAQTWHTFLVNLKKVQLGYLSGTFTYYIFTCMPWSSSFAHCLSAAEKTKHCIHLTTFSE